MSRKNMRVLWKRAALALVAGALALSVQADGFLVTPHPIPIPPPHPRPHPPPHPRPHPPPRPVFAPVEILRHDVHVKIVNQTAITEVDQEFHNPLGRRLEAMYLFPVPRGAQVDDFSVEVDGRTAEAELLDAKKARRIYEDIVRRHRDPALLEYAGQNLFRIRLFPLGAHETRRVKLRYTQLLRAEGGLLEYLYPLDTERFSLKPIPRVRVEAEIRDRRPIKTIYSPSHAVKTERSGPRRARVAWSEENVLPDRDFQLFYSVREGPMGADFFPCRRAGEPGYFLLLVVPEQESSAPPAPKDAVFVIDTSGSMAGRKIEQAKAALRYCLQRLRKEDRFEVIRFSTEAETLFGRLVPAGPERIRRAERFVDRLE
ncbi:MAG: VWA domain-containing protein, partial [Verrucomicrobia bacterium]|nr:VWA domain-containing protein [Verrucomicrobiota bacterium]